MSMSQTPLGSGVAVALAYACSCRLLAWEPPDADGVALKGQKTKKKKRERKRKKRNLKYVFPQCWDLFHRKGEYPFGQSYEPSFLNMELHSPSGTWSELGLIKYMLKNSGVPIVAQWKRIWLVSMRMWVPSLATISGLRIHCCRELRCRCRCSSDSTLL